MNEKDKLKELEYLLELTQEVIVKRNVETANHIFNFPISNKLIAIDFLRWVLSKIKENE